MQLFDDDPFGLGTPTELAWRVGRVQIERPDPPTRQSVADGGE